MTEQAVDESVVIGLTGGIACGKSTVTEIFRQNGFEILDTDEVAHRCLARDGACFSEVVDRFGSGILDEEGGIDRRALGRMVFESDEKRTALESILHPVIRSTWRAWVQGVRERKSAGCVSIPLLFEVGATDGWDAIVCVSAQEEVVMDRLLARGHSEKEAKERISAQWPIEKKEKQSDYVIRNDGSIEDLEEQTKQLIEKLLG